MITALLHEDPDTALCANHLREQHSRPHPYGRDLKFLDGCSWILTLSLWAFCGGAIWIGYHAIAQQTLTTELTSPLTSSSTSCWVFCPWVGRCWLSELIIAGYHRVIRSIFACLADLVADITCTDLDAIPVPNPDTWFRLL